MIAVVGQMVAYFAWIGVADSNRSVELPALMITNASEHQMAVHLVLGIAVLKGTR
jgi:hypothetical protein